MKISVKGIVTSVALKRKVTRDDEYDVLAFKIEIARDRSQYTNLADLMNAEVLVELVPSQHKIPFPEDKSLITRARKNKGELT